MDRYKTTTLRDGGLWGWLLGLTKNIRFYIVLSSTLIAAFIYLLTTAGSLYGAAVPAALARSYGLLAILYLYMAVLITPLLKRFPRLKGSSGLQFARRGIGVSAFGFGVLHAAVALFGQLGGLSAITHLQPSYQLSLALGTVSLVILFIMAAISFDLVIRYMGFPRWKLVQRLVYLALLLAIVHLITAKADFTTASGFIPLAGILGLVFLAYLEIRRVIIGRYGTQPAGKTS